MKNGLTSDLTSLRVAIRTAARVARRRAFRKGLPVAISKNGRVLFVYKDNREEEVNPSVIIKSR